MTPLQSPDPAAPGRPPNWALTATLVVTIGLWASAFAGIKAALGFYSPGHLALLRLGIASLLLGLISLRTRPAWPARGDWPGLFAMGFLGFTFYNVALNQGEMSVPAGTASFLIQTAPIWTVLLARLFLREQLNARGWAGIGVSLCGAGILAFGSGGDLKFDGGAALILLAALSASGYNIWQKTFLPRYDALRLTSFVVWAGTLPLLVFAPGLGQAIHNAPPGATGAVVFLGIFPSAVGYVLWARVMSGIPASRAASFLYTLPAAAFVIAWLWLGEVPSPTDVVGGALALFGVVLVNARRK